MWGCTVHNEVNKSLGKEIFDCARVGEVYDCGCGNDEGNGRLKGVIAVCGTLCSESSQSSYIAVSRATTKVFSSLTTTISR